jgi:hypothetical protein
MIKNRPDFVFSFWIVAWFIFYELKIVKYNPKIAIIFAIIVNLIMLSMMFFFNNSWINILSFCVVNFFIKVLPLIHLRNTEYKWIDFYALVVLYIIYLLWTNLNGVNIKQIAFQYYNNTKNKKPLGPIMKYINHYVNRINQ